jgi:hypothetical protein
MSKSPGASSISLPRPAGTGEGAGCVGARLRASRGQAFVNVRAGAPIANVSGVAGAGEAADRIGARRVCRTRRCWRALVHICADEAVASIAGVARAGCRGHHTDGVGATNDRAAEERVDSCRRCGGGGGGRRCRRRRCGGGRRWIGMSAVVILVCRVHLKRKQKKEKRRLQHEERGKEGRKKRKKESLCSLA